MTTAALRPASLGADLRRRRLEHRAARLRRVLAALDDRALWRRDLDGDVPGPLQEAIAGFRRELTEVEKELGRIPAAS
jgi:hypothetical protein